MTHRYCTVLTTTSNQEEAERLAEILVARRLVACVQMTNIKSFYRWQGQIHKDAEVLLIIKTASQRYGEVESAILENHSYEVPEIVQIPITQGLDRYLAWIDENTRQTPPEAR